VATDTTSVTNQSALGMAALLERKPEQPIIQFTPEQAGKERQRMQEGGHSPQPLGEEAKGTLPLPPKGSSYLQPKPLRLIKSG